MNIRIWAVVLLVVLVVTPSVAHSKGVGDKCVPSDPFCKCWLDLCPCLLGRNKDMCARIKVKNMMAATKQQVENMEIADGVAPGEARRRSCARPAMFSPTRRCIIFNRTFPNLPIVKKKAILNEEVHHLLQHAGFAGYVGPKDSTPMSKKTAAILQMAYDIYRELDAKCNTLNYFMALKAQADSSGDAKKANQALAGIELSLNNKRQYQIALCDAIDSLSGLSWWSQLSHGIFLTCCKIVSDVLFDVGNGVLTGAGRSPVPGRPH